MAVKPPADTGFRRRLPLELTADELEILEAAEPTFGTKRATLVAGLRALAHLAELERELVATRRACELAEAKADELGKREKALAEAQEKEKAASGTAKKARARASESIQRAQVAEEQVDDLLHELTIERQARSALEAELEDVERELFTSLRCPRCGAWTKPEEWAEKRHGGHLYVFHEPCGFHPGGLLDPTSVFGTRAE